MWKNGGIKIEFTAGRYFVEFSENLCVFFIKRSVTPNLKIETFLGPAPTEKRDLPTKIVALVSFCYGVLLLQKKVETRVNFGG